MVLLYVLCVSASATTRYVPSSEYSTIQSAIDASQDGDVIVVSQGTYVENLEIVNKSITLMSTEPGNAQFVAGTIIDGNQNGSVIRITGDASTNTVIRGLTIQNGNAFYDNPATPNPEPATESYNFKNCGGGICVATEVDSSGEITHFVNNISVYNCVIQDNYAAVAGGGLFNIGGSVRNCTVIGNSAGYFCCWTSNAKKSYGQGGGLAFCDAIDNCYFSNNWAFEGGGLFGCNGIYNSEISCNYTKHYYQNLCAGAYLTVAGDGAGASSCEGLYDCRLYYNYVQMCTPESNSFARGGGLYECDAVENCEIIGNISQCGGGLYSCGEFSYPYCVTGCIISCNTSTVTDSDYVTCIPVCSTPSYGGGGAQGGVLVGCTISNNSAYRGGGVFNSMVFTSVISGNTAYSGGGVYCTGDDSGSCNSCLISGNTVTQNGAAAAGSSVKLKNCTVVGNSGGNFVIEPEADNELGEAKLRNCIIWDNLPSNAINDDEENNDGLEVQYCCFPEGSVNVYDESNKHNNPLFVQPRYWNGNFWVEGDYHLTANSGCIDAGLNSVVPSESYNPKTDLDGNDRIVDFTLNGTDTAIVDMGCYEAIDGPVLIFPNGTTGESNAPDNTHDGTLMYGAMYVNGGHTRTALQLDGVDDYLEIDDYTGISGNASRICAAWINTTDPNCGVILSWGLNQTGEKWIFRVGTTGKLEVGVWDGYIMGTIPINDGTWHHVAAVLDGDKNQDGNIRLDDILLYVDGKQETTSCYGYTGDLPLITTDNTQTVKIGVRVDGGNYDNFQGRIDDVKIYIGSGVSNVADKIKELAGPKCHWKLDESTGYLTHDNTVNTYHGMLRNFDDGACSPAITGNKWKRGIHNNALCFDGSNDYVETPANIINTAQDSFSAFAWVRLDAQGAATQCILQQSDNNGTGRGWLFRRTNNTLGSNIGDCGLSSSQTVFATTGQWHHVGITYNRSTQILKLYVDGVESGSKSATGENCTGAIYIGRHKTDLTTHWNGLIDDVRVYDRVLRTDEIQVLADPMVAYWKLDGNTFDSSGNEFNGSLKNNPNPVWSAGRIGEALQFDGVDDYVETPANIINPAQDSFSAFAWIRLDAKGSNYQVILQQTDANGIGRGWLYRCTDNRLQCNLGNSSLTTSQAIFAQTGQWRHVGLTYNRPTQTLKLYVDGIEAGSKTTTAESCLGALFIGRHKTDPTTHWNGLIDDVRIYKQVLTEDKILVLAGDLKELKAHWMLDETSGTVAYDSVGTNNGALLNMTGNEWTTGKIGNCLGFDGMADYIKVLTPSGHLNCDFITMSAWVKADTTAGQQFVINRKMTNPGTYCIFIQNGLWKAQVRLNGSESTGRIVQSISVASTDWTHLCATYDGEYLSFYVNGVLENYLEIAGSIDKDNPNELTIGAHPNPVSYFDGLIDDVRVYDRPLTPNEVQELAGAGQ
jgi:hypothetical protein